MPANEYQFLRNAEVIIGERVKGTNGPVEPQNGRRYGKDGDLAFRITFKVEKDETGKANKSVINIYNLSRESINYLERPNLIIFLRVGYGENPLSALFFGDIVRFNEKREGPNVITVIECGDAEFVIKNTNIQIGFGPGVTNKTLFKLAADKLLVSSGFLDDMPEIKYLNGFSYSGQVSKLLDQLTKQVNYKWSIQDGELILLGPKKSDQAKAVFLSPETGLTANPTKTKDGVEFDALLNADVRPGRAAVIQSSKFMKGQGQTVRVSKTVHEGDTHGGKWTVHAEGKIV